MGKIARWSSAWKSFPDWSTGSLNQGKQSCPGEEVEERILGAQVADLAPQAEEGGAARSRIEITLQSLALYLAAHEKRCLGSWETPATGEINADTGNVKVLRGQGEGRTLENAGCHTE